MKELKKLLSSDPVLKTMKMKLTGSLRGTISTPKLTPNVLEAFRRLINLLPKLGFTSGTFDAQVLLECNHDRVIAAGKSLFKTYGPLIGVRDPVDRPHGPTDHVANHNGSSSHNDQRFPQG